MKILVVSDTHRVEQKLIEAIEKEKPIDMLIHAGDTCGNDMLIKNMVDCPVKMVLGNNDYSAKLSYNELFEVGGVRVLLTHGHRDGVYMGTDRLIYKAMENDAQVVIYGHTHIPEAEYDEQADVYCVNPGSLTYPRQAGHQPSYIVMTIDDYGEPHFEIKYI